MYNRYIHNDHGVYTPLPNDDSEYRSDVSFSKDLPHKDHNSKENETFSHTLKGLKESLNTLSGRIRLDTGDFFLIAILYFLYKEKADEELLIALALLLLL